MNEISVHSDTVFPLAVGHLPFFGLCVLWALKGFIDKATAYRRNPVSDEAASGVICVSNRFCMCVKSLVSFVDVVYHKSISYCCQLCAATDSNVPSGIAQRLNMSRPSKLDQRTQECSRNNLSPKYRFLSHKSILRELIMI